MSTTITKNKKPTTKKPKMTPKSQKPKEDVIPDPVKIPSDKELMDWLEDENKKAEFTGRCKFKRSKKGKGWRIHETKLKGAPTSVREAIARAMQNGHN